MLKKRKLPLWMQWIVRVLNIIGTLLLEAEISLEYKENGNDPHGNMH